MADLGSSLLWGSRPWNSQIRYLSVLIAAPNSSLQQASSFSFTIRISKTIPSAVNSARRSAPTGVQESGRKPEPNARRAERRPRFRFVPRKDVLCCADPASRRFSLRWHRLRRRPRRLEGRLDRPETVRLKPRLIRRLAVMPREGAVCLAPRLSCSARDARCRGGSTSPQTGFRPKPGTLAGGLLRGKALPL